MLGSLLSAIVALLYHSFIAFCEMMRVFCLQQPKRIRARLYPLSELPAKFSCALPLISPEIPRSYMSGLLRYAAEILRGTIDIDNTRG